MGRRKKGSNKRGASNLEDAVSDEDIHSPGEADLYDEVDNWDREQDRELLGVTRRQGRKAKSEVREMFALSGTDSDSDLELPKLAKKKKKNHQKQAEVEEEIELKDEDFLGSDVEGGGEENIRAWGSKKKHFYGGNTGEGIVSSESEFDEDEAEEREAEELQSRQLERMEEEDFLDAYILPANKDTKTEERVAEESVKRDLSSLSKKEQAALFRQQNPEFDGIVLDFKEKMDEAIMLSKIVSLEDQGRLPRGPVTEYIRTKYQVLTNYCTNITAYLMFKAKGTNLKLHPVTGRLIQYKQLLDSLKDKDAIVLPQVKRLLGRLEMGEQVEDVVKEERRRIRKQHLKKTEKRKKLKLLEKKRAEETVEESPAADPAKTKKRKQEKVEELTRDERMAVELYRAIKRKKTDLEEEEESGEEEMKDQEAEQDEELDEEEGEKKKRGITYQIAKNKGLMPKRSKLQRNPRVKNRVKFEKAKKRRKGAVREVRTETKKYGGEISGINARVKKGVKFR